MRVSRREFARLALAAVPVSYAVRLSAQGASARPNSVVRGVTIGMNMPYNFGGRNAPINTIISNLQAVGVSAMELRSQPVESFMGAPDRLVPMPAPRAGGAGAARGGGRGAAPAGGAAAAGGNAAELEKWRLGVSMDRATELRRRFEEAGISVGIMKVDGIFGMSDAVVDYQFRLAKALGARAISTEIDEAGTARLGKFADKHQTWMGYHGHATTSVEHFEHAFSEARFNGANLDIGHFVAGQNMSPVPFITKYHDRITHLHIKDRKLNNGPNVPFGQGDTPIVEVLRLIRDNRWNIQATIEFEYPVPEGSDRLTEIRKTVEFCRNALA